MSTLALDALELEALAAHAGISTGAAEYVLAFADDEHMIGARHTEWIGLGPFLEEDLAFCSIAQDECGHALALYSLLTDDVDRLALRRRPDAYRSSPFAELATPEWDRALVRHWLYDRAETLRWQALAASSHRPLAEIAERAVREERFHLLHAERFMAHITSDDEGRAHVRSAAADLLPRATTLFVPVAGEPDALSSGVATASSADLYSQWRTVVGADIAEWRLDLEVSGVEAGASGRTERDPSFDEFHASLTEVIAEDPTATW